MKEQGLLVVTGASSGYAEGTVAEGIVGRGVLTAGAVGELNGKQLSIGWIENKDGRQRSALAGESVKIQLEGATKFDFKKGDEIEFTT